MFYKLTGISPKTGKGKVSVIYRQPDFETMKSTGVSVAKADFDIKTGKVKPRVPEHPELNQRIQEVVNSLEKAVRDVRSKYGAVTKERLDTELTNQINFKEAVAFFQPTFEQVIAGEEQQLVALENALNKRKANLQSEVEKVSRLDLYHHPKLKQEGSENYLCSKLEALIKANPENRRKNTVDGYQDLLDRLREFRPEVPLQQVNLKFLQEFQSSLIAQGKRNGTVRAYLERFKKLYTVLADEAELPTGFLKKLVMVDELQSDNVIFLTDEEVEAIENIPLESFRQSYVRAQFLFSCETALRHSDLYITAANIKGDELHIVMKKAKRTVKPPLTDKAKAILNSEYFPFKKIPTSQYNQAIQAVCRKIPMFHQVVTLTHFVGNEPVTKEYPKWQLVGSHVGRKTAINKWLRREVRESVVALWAGHKNTRMIEKHYQNREAASSQEVHKLKG